MLTTELHLNQEISGELRTTIRWLLKRKGMDIEESPFNDEWRDTVKELHIIEKDLRLREGARVCRINNRGA